MVAIISAAMRARQPKPMLRRIPVTMLGIAPGIRTWRMTWRREPPSVRTAVLEERGTVRTPTSVLKKTRKKIVLNMMKVTLAQPSPNQVTASGSQAIPDSALKKPAMGSSTGGQPAAEPDDHAGADRERHADDEPEEHAAEAGADVDPERAVARHLPADARHRLRAAAGRCGGDDARGADGRPRTTSRTNGRDRGSAARRIIAG